MATDHGEGTNTNTHSYPAPSQCLPRYSGNLCTLALPVCIARGLYHMWRLDVLTQLL